MPVSGNLEDFLDWRVEGGFFPTQSTALALKSGSLPAMTLFQYPNFEKIEEFVKNEFGIRISIGKENVSPSSQRIEVSQDARAKVEEIFHDDIRLYETCSDNAGIFDDKSFKVSSIARDFINSKRSCLYSFWAPERDLKVIARR
ncbi:hypothetical protein GCM10007100_37540 [Roseibacillus persicicus]|uniref:Uncharacterized protein n=2 Tax=Roseibacillus persicicus TaxID=454148 RepID=A0A918U1L8_9BACT|nr:hypothetical protein GCM10007100_37540 [Roseibacillus persicicus]